MIRITILAVVLVVLLNSPAIAQIGFTEHTIADDFDNATSVYTVDLDSDGDTDVLGTASGDDMVCWWENDGEQEFERHVISDSLSGAWSVHAIDLDEDGDVDILGGGSRLVWFENDGEQNFTEYTIEEEGVRFHSVSAIDLDGDDDLDILGSGRFYIGWWENDGDQDFTQHFISNDFWLAWSVCATDLDGDGDLDVLVGADSNVAVSWWENDGEQEFTGHTIGHGRDVSIVTAVFATDLDSDDDMDVLVAAHQRGEIMWWENEGEEGLAEHTLGRQGLIHSVYAVDLDSDDDIDVVGAGGDVISWWENDGEQEFTQHIISHDLGYAFSVIAADVDTDGDIDVLGADYEANSIKWWESDLNDPLRWLPLPDTELSEDWSLWMRREYLLQYVQSENFHDSVLTISVENSEHLSGEMDDDGLTITPEENWFGTDSLMLIVTDPDENSATTYQRIEVTPVNDPPTEFDLLRPENNARVEQSERVDLVWNRSGDPDPGEEVRYLLRVVINDRNDPGYTDTVDIETEQTWHRMRFFRISGNNYWWVYAISGEDTTESNSRRRFLVYGSGNSVDPDELTVREFRLYPSFPNPFNGFLTFDIQLPQEDIINFQLYDITGRKVWSLSERFGVGLHRQSVDLNLNSAGVYFLKAESSFGFDIQRVVMLK